MPIRPYLDGNGFDQEHIDTMSRALTDACFELALRDKEDAAVQLLALRIIECAREGVIDPTLLKAAAVDGLGVYRQR